MKKTILFFGCLALTVFATAQPGDANADRRNATTGGLLKPANAGTGVHLTTRDFVVEQNNAATPVKNQQATGTCWSFSTTALLESQMLKANVSNPDLSEMFTVRNIYKEKARNYILRQGTAQFGEGALGHDVIRAIATYGAMPETAYSGHVNGSNFYNHQQMVAQLKSYLDSVLNSRNNMQHQTYIATNWMDGYTKILDKHMGVPPAEFVYDGKTYTAQSFAKDLMKFDAGDYVNITSFTHHPYYAAFVVEVPDNFSNGAYYNIPLKEMIELVKTSIRNGYTVLWDADVSNPGFQSKLGLALCTDSSLVANNASPDAIEKRWDENTRQHLYESLVTQDDHLMQITGLAKSKGGKQFFIVKNSHGSIGPFIGYIEASEAYFAINTISLVVPKASISKAMLDKLKIN